jgi:hypothetical protein
MLLGYPRTVGSNLPLDLAFVIDSTGLMGGAIGGVADAANLKAEKLKTRGRRLPRRAVRPHGHGPGRPLRGGEALEPPD